MKRVYSAPAMERCVFRTEDVLSLSAIFAGFTDDKDNVGNWKWGE